MMHVAIPCLSSNSQGGHMQILSVSPFTYCVDQEIVVSESRTWNFVYILDFICAAASPSVPI
jgi:hypothetical protein